MNKILILTYYWPPSGGPGVQRWLKFSNYLTLFGYEPLVITPAPDKANYPVMDPSLVNDVNEKVSVYHTSTLEPYTLYKMATQRKQTPYSGFASETGREGLAGSVSRFIRGNLFVPDARVGWNRFAIARAREFIKQHNISTIITTSPPHSTQLTGLQLKKEFPHLRWIADLRDPWTDIYYYRKLLHLPFIKNMDKRLEKKVLENADAVVTVSEFVKDLFALKMSNPEKIHVITNGFDEKDFGANVEAVAFEKRKEFTIAYVGTLADEYDLTGFVEAFKGHINEAGNEAYLEFTGSISNKWHHELNGLPNNSFTGYGHTSHIEALKRMKQADMLLLVIPFIGQNQGIVTGKIFEYMAAGKPILGIGPLGGDAAMILHQTNTGQMFDYKNSIGMLQFISRIKNHPDQYRPDHNAIEQYSRLKLTEKLTQLFLP